MITSSHYRFKGSSPEANNVAAGMAAGGIPGALAAMALNKAKQRQDPPPCIMAYPPDVFIPRQQPVRFGGPSGVEGAFTGWAIKKGLDQLTSADRKKYDSIAKYKAPPQIEQGEQFLLSARSAPHGSAEKERYLDKAEERFLEGVAHSKTSSVHRADALRKAAIACKLKGSSQSVIDAHMERAKTNTRYGRNDLILLEKDTASHIGSARDALAFGISLPLMFVEAGARMLISPNASEHELSVSEKTFETLRGAYANEVEDTSKQLERMRDELSAGESSDEEWMNGNDRKAKGKSTGKGLRHKFI